MADTLPIEPAVVNAIQRGHKVEAIKLLRESRGIGLKEAKNLVDQYEGQGMANFQTSSSPASPQVALAFDQAVVDAINRGRKIEAIKILRQSRRIGLKEAKELVEDYCDKNGVKSQSVGESKFFSYAAAVIVIDLIGYFIYKYFF